MSTWVQTYSGKAFRLGENMKDAINIIDIAHHLSTRCRFNGAPDPFYSVAEHSVRMCMHAETLKCTKAQQLWYLLHDAGEAYLPDIPSPMKRMGVTIGGISFAVWEERIMEILIKRYKLDPMDDTLDLIMLATEKRDLMAPEPEPWMPLPEPLAGTIIPFSWQAAGSMFLNRFNKLWCGQCNNTGWTGSGINNRRCTQCNNDGD